MDSSNVETNFEDLLDKMDRKASPPVSVDHLLSLIRTTSCHFGCVYIVVDALDECPVENRNTLLPALLDLKSSGLSLFVSSRGEYDIAMTFDPMKTNGQTLSVSHSPGVQADIQLHVNDCMQSHRALRDLPEKLKDDICTSLVRDKTRDGM